MMDWYPIVANVVTTFAFVSFLGIVWWAYSRRRKERFDAAAQAPFALPDELEQGRERQQ
jgi:cytochrome c oxidase cbb3-type subunit 4